MRHPRTDPVIFRQDKSRFLDPADDAGLLAYFEDLAKWHGYVRFLGLPHLRENPDQPLWELYVEPYLAARPIHVDEDPERWSAEVMPALTDVVALPRLVILGDPGSGKSTLVSWISWQLGCPPRTPWREALGPLVPLPMVLRELELSHEMTWDSLLAAFLAHPVAEHLRPPGKLQDLLERGQAFPLLDGLDEVGSVEVRKALRAAAFEGAERFPSCRFLVTSRIVGYEVAPFVERLPAPAGHQPEKLFFEVPWGGVRYVAPFTDEQIARFAQNWYARREAAETRRDQGANDLVRAIHGNVSTRRLARNPNLLTLMALIHRVQARLPHGRALLFEKIAEAYLESIDTFRGLMEAEAPLSEKKRWLAYIGFRMQLQRKRILEPGEPREVLADRDSVERWILEASERSSRRVDPESVAGFLDYVGRRSGLLLPRGNGLYAFTHLSFQEYFAALFLAEQITAPRWSAEKAVPGAAPADVHRYANEIVWQETLVLLFELLADRPEWVEFLSAQVFGEDFAEVARWHRKRNQEHRAELLAEVSVDPHTGLTAERRAAAWEACWRWELADFEGGSTWSTAAGRRIALILSGAVTHDIAAVWAAFGRAATALSPRRLDLSNTALVDISLLSELHDLDWLDLGNTSVSDVSALAGLSNLSVLVLGGTDVEEISPLRSLTKLSALNLEGTRVSDVSALSDLTNLHSLNLSETGVTDLSALSRLVNLEELFLESTEVEDVTPLAQLHSLRTIDLSYTQVVDVSPLASLTELEWLHLAGTGAHGVSALRSSCPRLKVRGFGG